MRIRRCGFSAGAEGRLSAFLYLRYIVHQPASFAWLYIDDSNIEVFFDLEARSIISPPIFGGKSLKSKTPEERTHGARVAATLVGS